MRKIVTLGATEIDVKRNIFGSNIEVVHKQYFWKPLTIIFFSHELHQWALMPCGANTIRMEFSENLCSLVAKKNK